MTAAVLIAPIAIRLALMSGELGVPDLRGLFADVVVCLFVTAILLLARRLALPLITLWCVLNYGSYEHVVALGTLPSLTQVGYLTDGTFLLGSALVPSQPLQLAGILCVSWLLVWHSKQTKVVGTAIAALVGLCALLLWPTNPEALTWRQTNVVAANVRWLVTPTTIASTNPPTTDSFYQRDLSGEPIVELGQARNVLLVMLEGLSGVHIGSIAEAHDIFIPVKMSRLDRVAQQNVLYTSFVAQQRQTNRGEYAMLCGDYPKLVATSVSPAKMTEALSHDSVPCLPNVLRDVGYETVYLQAAPLGFMSKDKFMPKAGFAHVHGVEWFKPPYAAGPWGVGDKPFFEQSLQMVRALTQRPKPWFLTLLTVGTHHPYVMPGGHGEFPAAADYLDEVFAPFLVELREMGVLDNTLVLITSDESVGLIGFRSSSLADTKVDDVTKKLTDGWGFLVAMLPTGEQARVDGDFMQSDLALSVVDYLGVQLGGFIGRSVFRSYDQPRPIVFGSLSRQIVVMRDGHHLLVCPANFEGCMTYVLLDGRLFSLDRVKVSTDPRKVELLRAVVARTDLETQQTRRETLYQE